MGTTPEETAIAPPCVVCNDDGWVCEFHPDRAWHSGEACCGAAGRPCVCQEMTVVEVNALPAKVRQYIHDLHVGYDPRGDVRRQVIELHIARENATALGYETVRLHRIVARLKEELRVLRKVRKRQVAGVIRKVSFNENPSHRPSSKTLYAASCHRPRWRLIKSSSVSCSGYK